MSQQNQPETSKVNWKTKTYLLGAILGSVMGFLSAYLFAKEAEDPDEDKESAPDIPPTAMLGLALSILGVVRQIAETGRKKKDGKK